MRVDLTRSSEEGEVRGRLFSTRPLMLALAPILSSSNEVESHAHAGMAWRWQAPGFGDGYYDSGRMK